MVALVFPGQGSQFVGMGRELAAQFPVARDAFAEADDLLGFALSKLAWEGPEDELTRTHNAQPAILVHSIAVHRVVSEHIGPAAAAAGHSLGEFTAYVVAGAMSFADAVRTVRRRGELMLRAGHERPGTMAAILGLDDDKAEAVCRDATAESGDCVPANFNSPGQIVISGDVRAVERAIDLAKAAGARRALPLSVSGAFHSPLMEPAVAGLEAQLSTVAFDDPKFPVVSNVTAQPITDAVSVRRLLLEQLTSPVRWTACVQAMRAMGVNTFLELGPGSVLTGLLKRIDREADGRAIGTLQEVQSTISAGV